MKYFKCIMSTSISHLLANRPVCYLISLSLEFHCKLGLGNYSKNYLQDQPLVPKLCPQDLFLLRQLAGIFLIPHLLNTTGRTSVTNECVDGNLCSWKCILPSSEPTPCNQLASPKQSEFSVLNTWTALLKKTYKCVPANICLVTLIKGHIQGKQNCL